MEPPRLPTAVLESRAPLRERLDAVLESDDVVTLQRQLSSLTKQQPALVRDADARRDSLDRATASLARARAHASECASAVAAARDRAATVEAVVAAARQAAECVTRRQLDQIKHYTSPPEVVRRTVELMYMVLCADKVQRGAPRSVTRSLHWKANGRGGMPRGGLVSFLAHAELVQEVQAYPPEPARHPLCSAPSVVGCIAER